MSRYSVSAVPLWTTDPFRRWVGYSAAAHALTLLVIAIGPGMSSPTSSQPVFVNLVAAPEPRAAKLKPKAEPAAKKQVVDEAIVIRKEPKKKAEAKPKPPPKPAPEKAPKAKPAASADDILAQLRAKVAKRAPAQSAASMGLEGRPDDPVLAAYKARVMTCLYQHWTGARAFSRQSELEVQFRVRVGAGGQLSRVTLTRSSSNRYLDQSAERAIRKCDPFEPPPRGVSEFNLTFNPADLV